MLTSDEDKRVWQLLQTHAFHIQGMAINISEFCAASIFYLSIFTLGLGALNVLLVKNLPDNRSALNKLAAVNLIIATVLLAVTALFFHLPPLILFSLVTLLFLTAFFTLA